MATGQSCGVLHHVKVGNGKKTERGNWYEGWSDRVEEAEEGTPRSLKTKTRYTTTLAAGLDFLAVAQQWIGQTGVGFLWAVQHGQAA